MPKFKCALAAAVFVGGTSAAAAFCEVPSYNDRYGNNEADYYDCAQKETAQRQQEWQKQFEERAKEEEESQRRLAPHPSNPSEDD